ncbi:MAG TPA: FAD:protein FMN transferase [Candidatus Saccharimonadales bacterium]|nr:FAD:protein FMN transferase [Candidatus Saccharimonadales bacterium]
MKQTELIMGMPITVEIAGSGDENLLKKVFDYFRYVDGKYSTYKEDSEISMINKGLAEKNWSDEMKHVLKLCEDTKHQTMGYFDIEKDGKLDPSGLVKGWAIRNAANLLKKHDAQDFYIDAGGDIQVSGVNADGELWKIGVRNPFNRSELIKSLRLKDGGIATSGTAVRGRHIYNPKNTSKRPVEAVSLTVVGPDIYEADRFATAAFAMGPDGIHFIESLAGYEGYQVTNDKMATETSGLARYVHV